MGLILDLAVTAIAAVVVGSLALLAWTLGVSSVRSVRRARRDVAMARATVGRAEARMTALARAARADGQPDQDGEEQTEA
ncbi:MAG TPA: hypothetical protein VHR55_12705 [Candidatus Limnocylindria bacterium]|nr:hypothetical protein [Candidatus Limnocylindria bacterium]